jgi:Tfp pilus assembly protein PilX
MNTANIHSQKGSALIIVIAVLFLASLIGVQMFSIANDDMSISFNAQDASQAFYAAEAGLAIARSQLWADYVNWASTDPYKEAGEIGSRATYTAFLDNLGLTDSAKLMLAADVNLGNQQVIDSVTVLRTDQIGATMLTVTSTGRSTNYGSRTITSVLQVEGEAFKGFEFAILANNVNCIMCHATIDNAARVYNTDTTKIGTFDRVKIASLESLLLRTTSADSRIAGTVYTRGIVTDKQGNPITNLSPTGTGLEGYAISSTDGKIIEPLTTVPLTNTTGSPLPQYGNLYLNYPTDESQMTDGVLPETFPPPFPDDNSNKMVDDAEFQKVANNASGAITGGIIYAVPKNGNYNSNSLPSSGNKTSISQSHSGHLILVGTESNPIVINGDVAIDGDVVIQGVVKGTGQIFARGNIYVTGDLTYADGEVNGKRTFGVAADGTQNALSLAAGKNILVGDYLTTKDGNLDPGNLANGEKFSFTMSEITLFNRSEWAKTQEFLPDGNGGLVPNPNYIPGYQPRYYTLNDGDPVYIYNKSYVDNKGKVKGAYFDPVTNTWIGKEHVSNYDLNYLTKLDPGDPQLAGATVVSLSATNNWIDPVNLKGIWDADEANRTPGEPFKIDGQLYTNNSIFTLTRKSSKTNGFMVVNGALVAADIGVLSGGGLYLYYDQRLKTFLKIKDDSKVTMAQIAWFSE